MKKQMIIMVIVVCLMIGFLSGCTEQENATEMNANFEYSPSTNIYKNMDITFTNKSTGENIISWDWDFGDGTKSSTENPIHQYSETGEYAVTLKILDSNGVNSTISKKVDVVAKPPTASFMHPTEEIYVDSELNFVDTSTPGDADIVSWLWEFSDGDSATTRNITHVFRTEAMHTAKLTVTDADGLTGSHTVGMSVAFKRI